MVYFQIKISIVHFIALLKKLKVAYLGREIDTKKKTIYDARPLWGKKLAAPTLSPVKA